MLAHSDWRAAYWVDRLQLSLSVRPQHSPDRMPRSSRMATTNRGGSRLRAGDVIEVQADFTKWFLCYLGRDELLGDTTWVVPQPYALDAPLECRIFAGEGYYAFYPATTALRRGMVRKVGFCAEGMRVLPRLFRFGSPFDREGEPRTWRIAEAAQIGVPFVIRTSLSADEALIPQASIWNHEFLLNRLRANWHPRQEASDSSSPAA